MVASLKIDDEALLCADSAIFDSEYSAKGQTTNATSKNC